ncbi:MAG TPA: PaaI family thioesterase [Methylomirabilota bacterium]|nr:PaaI family thioesterase [Methylomirabilota bacterium]
MQRHGRRRRGGRPAREVGEARAGAAGPQLSADGRHANPMGTGQGGVLCSAVDGAMGRAYLTTLMGGESFTALEMKINVLRPVRAGRLTASARVRKGGRMVGLVECEVTDEAGQAVAYATSTCPPPRGEQAVGGTIARGGAGARRLRPRAGGGRPAHFACLLANCTRASTSCQMRRPIGPELYCATAIVASGLTTKPVAWSTRRRSS